MKLYTIGLTLAAIAGGLSCASSNTSTPQEERAALVSKPGAALDAQANSKHGQDGRGTQSRATQIAGPTIPKDAQWTILCTTITGPDHAGQGRAARTNLINQTKMPDWYTVSGEGRRRFIMVSIARSTIRRMRKNLRGRRMIAGRSLR